LPGSTGIRVISASYGDSHNLSIRDCNYGVYSTTVGAKPAGIANVDSTNNSWENVAIIIDGHSGAGTMGVVETGIPAAGVTAYSKWRNTSITWMPWGENVGYGLYLQAVHSSHFQNLHFTIGCPADAVCFPPPGGGGGGVGGGVGVVCAPCHLNPVTYDYGLNSSYPSSNTIDFMDMGTTGYMVNGGTPGADAKPNWLSHFVLSNRAKYPALDNLLVDHASGTWTPDLIGTTGGSTTYTKQIGSYESNGYKITARFHLVTSARSGQSGVTVIRGLPLFSTSNPDEDGACSIATMTGVDLHGYKTLSGYVQANANYITLTKIGSGLPWDYVNPAGDFAGATELRGVCTYTRKAAR